ncbi:MAG: STT3 domain-containing protein [Candidatus Aenigmatarchaeota archaeon]
MNLINIEKIKENVAKKINYFVIPLLLLLIIYFAFFVRLKTAYVDIPLDYDPWWFFRHAKDIVERWDREKKFVLSTWDEKSYFPPGRPIYYDGYSYTIALTYLLVRDIIQISLEKYSVYFVAIFSALTAIPAFFLARILSKNNLAGLFAAFLITFSPAFLIVSMAGYVDSDVVYVFYTYLVLLSTILLIEKSINTIENINIKHSNILSAIKKLVPYFIFASISYILFAWNWNSAYYFIPIIGGFLILYLILSIVFDSYVNPSKKKTIEKTNSKNYLTKILGVSIVLGTLILFTELLTFLIERTFNTSLPHPITTILWQFDLAIKGGLKYDKLVNISVAELQVLNPFSIEGIKQIASRVGLIPFLLSFLIFPIFVYNFFFRRILDWKEIFLIVWFIYSLYLISQGIRFSLLFATSLAIVASYSIFTLHSIIIEILQKSQKVLRIFNLFFFSFLAIFIFYYLDHSFKIANAMKGMEINENWRAALDFIKNNSDEYTLVATWWDPGHIIAGYANVKVHADGAHCGWDSCIPYNHDIRIQDMGRILTTSNETEAYELLKKYTRISEEDCKRVKERFPTLFNESICNITINKIYFIVSQDLIFKYYWPSYFSSCLRKYYPENSICYTQKGIENFFYINKKGEGNAYSIFILNIQKSDINRGILVYSTRTNVGGRIIEVDISIKTENINNQTVLVPYFMNRERIKYLVYYQDNKPIIINQEEFGIKSDINAMVIIDPSFRYIFLANEEIMNSMFTRMYFLNGIGLEKFELVFDNPEVKIYKVSFN